MLIDVASSAELEEGEMLAIERGEQQIALFRVDGTVRALANVCTHQFALMTDGYFDGESVECPLHQARFDVATGKRLEGPNCDDLRVFTASEQDGRIMIDA